MKQSTDYSRPIRFRLTAESLQTADCAAIPLYGPGSQAVRIGSRNRGNELFPWNLLLTDYYSYSIILQQILSARLNLLLINKTSTTENTAQLSLRVVVMITSAQLTCISKQNLRKLMHEPFI